MARHTPITIPTDFRDGEQKKYHSLSMSAHVCIHGLPNPLELALVLGGRLIFELKRGATVPVATGWS
jgi:hypothetical protein